MGTRELSTTEAAESSGSRLRLKRVFLRTLVLSLTACALVAVVALLIGQFTQTTGRILGTLGALAFHSGFAMACAQSLERRRWPQLSVLALALLTLNFAVLLTCIWWPGVRDETLVRALATTGHVILFYLLAIPAAYLLERHRWRMVSAAFLALLGADFIVSLVCTWWPDVRDETYFRAASTTGWIVAFYVLAMPSANLNERNARSPLSVAGLAACVAAFVMTLICTWVDQPENVTFGKATLIMCAVAFSLAHTNLLVGLFGTGRVDWLLRGVVACIWALAVLVSGMIIWEPSGEFWFRLLGALGVLDASGSLALAIVARLRQVGKIEKLQSTPARIEIRCPRCTTPQTVDAGASKCGVCGLKFRIEIEEPRCEKCDYLLWQLPERRCPECGTAF